MKPSPGPIVDSPLKERVQSIAAELRATLERVVLACAGPMPRPTKLVQLTGIDKTLAGRILRAARATTPLETLHVVPAPQGLQIFLRAAVQRGLDPALQRQAENSIYRFEQLLDEFAGSRGALDAALAGWLPETRARGERDARQAVFKAMSYLLGYHADATVSSLIVQPAADGKTCDVIHLGGKFGLRRLRGGAQLALCGTRSTPPADCPALPPMQTIDGVAETHDPARFLLEKYCSQPLPHMSVLKAENRFILALGEHEPPVNTPVTITHAYVSRNSWGRYRSPQEPYTWYSVCQRIPCRALLSDIFLHEDVYPGVEPTVTQWVQGITSSPELHLQGLGRLDEVDLSYETRLLEANPALLGTGEIPRYPELIEEAFQRMGWDAKRFRAHRLWVVYPLPSITITRWFALPPV